MSKILNGIDILFSMFYLGYFFQRDYLLAFHSPIVQDFFPLKLKNIVPTNLGFYMMTYNKNLKIQVAYTDLESASLAYAILSVSSLF